MPLLIPLSQVEKELMYEWIRETIVTCIAFNSSKLTHDRFVSLSDKTRNDFRALLLSPISPPTISHILKSSIKIAAVMHCYWHQETIMVLMAQEGDRVLVAEEQVYQVRWVSCGNTKNRSHQLLCFTKQTNKENAKYTTMDRVVFFFALLYLN